MTSGSLTGYPLLGSPTATICFGNHVAGQRAISGAPRIRHFRRPRGVIHPKEVDPAVEKPAPKTEDTNVVPPPGTSGGAPASQPI